MIQAYNLMMESYQPMPVAKNHVQKKNELKKIYENIVKLSKNTGFYKINLSKENQEYTLDVKEMATLLKSRVSELTDPTLPAYLQKYVAVNNENQVEAKLINEDVSRIPEKITMTVASLATPQRNIGKDLFHPTRSLERGIYDFRANIRGEAYDLTFHQKEKASNIDTMNRMADHLREGLPNLKVTVEEGKNKEYSHILLESNFTGYTGSREFYFEDADIYREGLVDFFGLNRMENGSENARFTINGLEKQTNSNTFQIENTLQITLLEADEKPVTLNILNDPGKILEKLDTVLGAVNHMIRLAADRTEITGGSYSARKLINEIKGVEEVHKEELAANGLMIKEDGTLSRDERISDQAARNGGLQTMCMKKNGFIAALLGKAEEISVNPMEYLDKTIVTYPDNKKTAVNPYMTSMYSGLFFSSYC